MFKRLSLILKKKKFNIKSKNYELMLLKKLLKLTNFIGV